MRTNNPSIIALLLAACSMTATAQSELYPKHFDLEQVTLGNGPMKTAMDLNISVLLQYDHYRLLTPYVVQAGLNTGSYAGWASSHPSFPNWGSYDFNLDGHVGGHYLTALSLAYAACHDATVKANLKTRLDYMVNVMKDCQDAYDNNTEGLKGFIGGQPIVGGWKALYANGDIAIRGYGKCAVPWYCQHKIMAGLRDAYIYGDNATARTVFLKLCDWAILVTSNLTDAQMESMLNTEHGGVNEVLLDAYKLTGDDKYLTAAKRFTHKTMLNGLQTLNTSFLDNKHANTQVPKYVGMERIAEESQQSSYATAADNFWADVAHNRTTCIGGNSVSEHFIAASNSAQYINNLDGPESCNTNNMLKLSEMMADRKIATDAHAAAECADFYEYAMWNHILSTQDPTTGGYVYFTTLRPQSYRIYSVVNEAMWCCVGTGMENHSKYGHFIYTHDGSATLYVNLFTPSSLSSDNFVVTQETSFPFESQTRLTIGKAGTYTVALRHPSWAGEGYGVKVNGTSVDVSVEKGKASYVNINRTWAQGDVITVSLPMELRYTTCPNYTDYIAFQYGPILLAAQTSTNDEAEAAAKHLSYEPTLRNEYAHQGRMDHAPGSRATSRVLTSMPLLLGERDGEQGVLSRITATDLSKLHFTLDASRKDADDYLWQALTLQPFYQIHHARYSCYWYQQTAENFANSAMGVSEAANAALAERTLDFVATGEQQSEAGHFADYDDSSNAGSYNNEYFRDARAGGYVQYKLSYEGDAIGSGLSVLCRFTQADANRKATLYVDGVAIANITTLAAFNGNVIDGFYNVEYPIPAFLMRDGEGNLKQSFTVRLAADKGTLLPGLYYLRLMKEYDDALPATVTTTAGDERTVIDGVVTGENGQSEMSHSFSYSGSNGGNNHGTYQNKYWRDGLSGEYYAYDLATNGETDGVSLVVEYWANDVARMANIDIDGVTIAMQQLSQLRNAFVTLEYPIDPALLEGKQKVNVKFTSTGNCMTPGSYHVYVTKGRTATARTKTPYSFVNENFEKNGNDGKISTVGYQDGSIQLTASGTGNMALNLRMKRSLKDTYSILPNQYLFTIKGQHLATAANLWWIMGCNKGGSDAPAYTLTDGDDTYLVWDLRKIANMNDDEKNQRFFGVNEVDVTTTNNGEFSLACFGLTSNAADGSATISDISFYSPEQLVDKYAVLKGTVASMATGLAVDSVFAYDGYVYRVTSTNSADIVTPLSGHQSADAPHSVFGYAVGLTDEQKVELNRQAIISQGGEATSLVMNPTCEKVNGGWTKPDGSQSGYYTAPRTWRNSSSSHLDNVNVRTTISQTISHMPAGYYKVVAAMRAADGSQITMNMNNSVDSTFTGFGDAPTMGSQINRNGVQMPYTVPADFAEETGRGWQWNAAYCHLTADGDLTINFVLNGNSWMAIDDVHLYYSEQAGGFFRITDENNDLTETSKVVTCDVVLNNPNTIITSAAPVITAAGANLNNNLIDGVVGNLVLYDEYGYHAPAESYAATSLTLRRSLQTGGYNTFAAPFDISSEKLAQLGITAKQLTRSEFANGTLTLEFANAANIEAGKPYLVKVSANVVNPTFENVTVNDAATTTTTDAVDFIPTLGVTTIEGDATSILFLGAGNKLYNPDAVSSQIKGFRAYFQLKGEAATARTFRLDFGNGETSTIEHLPTNIQHAASVYTLDGRRIEGSDTKGLKKGVYIIRSAEGRLQGKSGKKVFIR